MKTSEQIDKIVPALLKAKANMGAAVKDSKNPFFKSNYADLNSINDACGPALEAQGIIVLQPTAVLANGATVVETLLLHSSGQFLSSELEVVTAKERDPQAYGSGISYTRRYALQSLLNLAAVDDDGEAAKKRASAPTPVKSTPQVTVKATDNLVETVKVSVPTPSQVLTEVAAPKATGGSFKRPGAAKAAPAKVEEVSNDEWT